MTGWRLGYAIGNAETINNMVRIQQNTTSCATSFVQSAGVEALRGDQSSVEKMRRVYEKRRNRMVELLSDIDGVKCTKPRGAFYVFPDFSSYGITSERLAEIILRDIGAVCTPGHEFGEQCDYNLRLSYATSMEVIEEGAAMLKKYLESLEQAVRPTGTKRTR
jgi:aspartate/methionine/tyrosine aminotransferase